MFACLLNRRVQHAIWRNFSVQNVGFIGLGHMGSKMTKRLVEDGHNVYIYDKNPSHGRVLFDEDLNSPKKVYIVQKLEVLPKSVNKVISMLPNDAIVTDVAIKLLNNITTTTEPFIHISCSTISPGFTQSLI